MHIHSDGEISIGPCPLRGRVPRTPVPLAHVVNFGARARALVAVCPGAPSGAGDHGSVIA